MASGPPAVNRTGQLGRWVLLAYRIPREPSRPRIAVWRKLERLGVGRLGDGLVALPADARTREQLDWIAEEIGEARAAEYEVVIAEAADAAATGDAEQARAVRRLRAELRRIGRRDFFPPPHRDTARAAVQALADYHADADRHADANAASTAPAREQA